ncbi:uncharacterized protein N7479_006147 [Penicillium vulpinum]|uniref:uncharacterized protein n=1 Tax=Penicillium vulpinum TaxID=29845 RepID=UPI0025498969|nr:uncharacterized protein N7479_006147 [Penicillium vulpinum]KAJ5958997.1 hypothetical protein N7479_006147 [Penicillium vulpinum]
MALRYLSSEATLRAIAITISPTCLRIDQKSPKISKGTKTYNSEDSLVVTHPTTNSPACGLSTAERTGSPVFHTLWSYVLDISWRGL